MHGVCYLLGACKLPLLEVCQTRGLVRLDSADMVAGIIETLSFLEDSNWE